MPTTRSATKKDQTSLEDFKEGGVLKSRKNINAKTGKSQSSPKKSKAASSDKVKANTSAKRTSTDTKLEPSKSEPSKKRAKTTQSQLSTDSVNDLEKPIIINRSPVLQLWAAVVAQFTYPNQSWQTCLNAGSAIASLCAISKGKSIGAIEPVDRTEEEERSHKEVAEAAKAGATVMEVMDFPLFRKGEKVLVSGKPSSLKEETLKGKFGGEDQYEKVKHAMQQALEQNWKDDREELNKKAFHMYEKFRPTVAKGAAGWGRKGELNIHHVASTIKG